MWMFFKRKKNTHRGQAMAEYASTTAVLVMGCLVGGSASPFFVEMINGLKAYLNGIMVVLNFPIP